MKVIVTSRTGHSHPPRSVRKCPPNYRETFGKRYEGKEEYICELEDYTEEDIKNYFEIDTQIPDKDEEVHEC